MDLRRCVEMQELCDDLDLIGQHIDDALKYAESLRVHYKIESGFYAPKITQTFDPKRIRIWYDEHSLLVTAVIHG